jgi:chromosome segregation ATPase
VTNQIQQLQQTITELQAGVDQAQNMLIQIGTTIADAAPQEQEEIQATVQINPELTSLIGEVTQARIDRMSDEYRQRIQSIEKINVSFELVLADYFHNQEVDMIMEKLNFCRRINDFNYMRSIYDLYSDSPSNRELMKAICAMYRLNVKNYVEDSTEAARSKDRSIVKYATACPDCGEVASSLVDDLLSVGLKK